MKLQYIYIYIYVCCVCFLWLVYRKQAASSRAGTADCETVVSLPVNTLQLQCLWAC